MKRKFVAIFLLLVFVIIVGTEGFWLLSPHLASRGLWPFSSPVPEKTASIPSISGLHVAGNRLLNKDQQAIVPVGVGRSGTEAPCAQGWGIFDGPHDEANVNIMTTWQINTVRVSLNEDCWLGINGVQSKYSGTNYRQSIISYVNLLNSRNILVIIDLHWSAPGKDKALGQKPMPDLDHSVDFWKSVATTFKSNLSVLFELYNEPSTTSWQCWRDGSTAANAAPCADVKFAAAGMQSLVNTVRATGATNPILLDGLRWGNDMTNWLNYMPNDPAHNVMAALHVYNFNQCVTTDCWESQVLPVAKQVPLVITELGETDCAYGFVDNLMNWADRYNIGYTAWAWSSYGCGYPALMSSVNQGIPNTYGLGVMRHFQSLSSAGLKGYGEYSSVGNRFGEGRVHFESAVPLKDVSVVIQVQKDIASPTYSSASATFDQSQFVVTHTEATTQIQYSFALKNGAVMPPQNNYTRTLFDIQFKTNNNVHAAKKDTFILNAMTLDGQAVVLQGNIAS